MKLIGILLGITLMASCQSPQRNCEDFKEGTFEFVAVVNNVNVTTTFTRLGDLEIANFEGVIDSSSVKWINNCEYILKSLHPKSKKEESPIAIKILTTTAEGYTFEYGIVGSSKKARGNAKKIK